MLLHVGSQLGGRPGLEGLEGAKLGVGALEKLLAQPVGDAHTLHVDRGDVTEG